MKYLHGSACYFLVAISTLAAVGCSGSDLPETAPVTGTITLDGKPHPNASVVFTPSEGRPSSGVTDANGNYQLAFTPSVMGAVPGVHTVRITTVPPPLADPLADPNSAPRFVDPIPKKYNTGGGLTATVESVGSTINFDLTTK